MVERPVWMTSHGMTLLQTLWPQSITVSTIRFLATDFNTGTITVSLNHILQLSLSYVTHKDFSSLLDIQNDTTTRSTCPRWCEAS
jgi:galactitol-specific phosphotransferase system IIC component